jgi:hypothetical protein
MKATHALPSDRGPAEIEATGAGASSHRTVIEPVSKSLLIDGDRIDRAKATLPCSASAVGVNVKDAVVYPSTVDPLVTAVTDPDSTIVSS